MPNVVGEFFNAAFAAMSRKTGYSCSTVIKPVMLAKVKPQKTLAPLSIQAWRPASAASLDHVWVAWSSDDVTPAFRASYRPASWLSYTSVAFQKKGATN